MMRAGAEEEYFIRGLNNFILLFNTIFYSELGPVETQEEFDELKVALPPIIKKPFEIPTYIFLVPHKLLKKYSTYFE